MPGSGAVKMPWSVKGVDAQARDAAKEAARRAGMTLGEWLNAVIAETAADEPEPPRRTRPGHDLHDLAERLSRLDRAAAETAVSAHQAQTDLEAVLRRAIADTTRRADAVEERTAGAMSAMVRWMERADERRREEIGTLAAAQERTSTALRDALALVTKRMDMMQQGLAGSGDPDVRDALSRLESRIDRLDRREAAAPVPPRIEAALRDLEGRLVAVAERIDQGTTPEPGQAQRIASIEAALGAILDRLDVGEEPQASIPAAAPGSLDEAMAQIRARQAALDGRARPPLPRDNARDGVVESLRGDLAQLSERIEALREITSRRAEERQSEADRHVATLRGDLADLTVAVKALAPQGRLDAIEDGLAHLGRRLETLARTDDRGAIAAPLQALGGEMGRITRALEPLRSLADLRADIAALARRLDKAQERPEPGAMEEIASGIDALKLSLAEAASGTASLAQVERRLEAMEATLQDLASRPIGIDHSPALLAAADELRSAAGAMQAPGLSDLRAYLKSIEDRVAEAPAATLSAAEAIRSAISGLPDLSRVETRLQAIEERVSEGPAAALSAVESIRTALGGLPDLSRVETRLQAIEERVAAPALSSGPAMEDLEGLIRGLGERIEAAGQRDAGTASFDALERQIAAMTEALGRGDEGLEALRSMEKSIADLFVRVEDGRLAVVEAAEAAALKAAQAVSGSMAGPADERTSEALDAVQATLGRIVERLARLEAGLDARRDDETQGAAQAEEAKSAPQSLAMKIAAAAAAAKSARQAEPVVAQKPVTLTPPPASLSPLHAEAALELGPELKVPDPHPETAEAPRAAVASSALQTADEELITAAVAAAARAVTVEGADTAGDRPLEPGTGRPVVVAPAAEEPVAAEPEAPKQSFISAARAAVAAQGRGKTREKQQSKPQAPETPASMIGVTGDAPKGSFLERTRRPILIGLAIVVLALGTAQIVRNMLAQNGTRAPAPAAPQETSALPPANDPTATGAIPPADVKSPTPLAPLSTGRSPSFTQDGPASPPPGTFTPAVPRAEPETVGSLGSAPVKAPQPTAIDPTASGMPALGEVARALLPVGLQDAAKAGNPVAAFDVANRLMEGRGLPRDPKGAIPWFEKAAAAGLAPAEYRLGSAYEKGTGVAVDLVKAREWYQRAAEKGNAKAMHNLGVLIADGSGKPDYATAAAWFRRAADLGVRDSQYNLAILAARGLGMQQNLGESYVWFSIAAGQGDEDAARKRDEVASRLDAAALATAKAAAAGFQARKPADPANEVALPNWDETAPVGTPSREKPKTRS